MRILALFAVSLFAGSVVAAPVPKDKAKDEAAIVGTWKFEEYDVGTAFELPAETKTKFRWTFKKDGQAVAWGTEAGERESGYKLDAAATPKAIDFTTADGVSPGLYELDGDTLKICKAKEGGTRPTEFKADVKAGHVVLTLKRVKDGKKDK